MIANAMSVVWESFIPVLILDDLKIQFQSYGLIRIPQERLAVKGYKDEVIDDIEVVERRRCRQRFGIIIYKIARNIGFEIRWHDWETVELRGIQAAEHGIVLGSV